MDNNQNQTSSVPASMSDEDKMTQAIASSYVDDYTPPSTTPTNAAVTPPTPLTPPMSTPVAEPVSAPFSMPTFPDVSAVSPVTAPMQPPAQDSTQAGFSFTPAPVSEPAPVQPAIASMSAMPSMPPVASTTNVVTTPVNTAPAPYMPPQAAPSAPVMMTSAAEVPEALVTQSEPPAPAVVSQPPMATPTPESAASNTNAVSQALEDQNIFYLLGLDNAKDEDKEAFLDELQQIIWEDFLENDVELLITEEEMVDFKKISDVPNISEEEKQGRMIDFLEKLIPDLEKIMLEKALELKEEMFRERMNDMKQSLTDRADAQAAVTKAMDLVSEQKWRAAADELNAIK